MLMALKNLSDGRHIQAWGIQAQPVCSVMCPNRETPEPPAVRWACGLFCREEMRNGTDIWGHSSSPAPFRLISTADLTGGREQGAGSLQGQ